MFWGLIMEPLRRYSQCVKKSFHVSMAALDETTSDETPTQVICQFDERNYLLCTLVKGKASQIPLDLNFEVGDKISFATNGQAHVHLTGYLIPDEEAEEEDEDEESEDEDYEKELDSKKRLLKAAIDSPPRKKSRTLELVEAVNSNDEDDSDDADVNMSDLIGDDTLDTTGIDEAEDEEDDDDDQDDEEQQEEEDDGDSEEDDSDEDEVEGEESDESSLSEDETQKAKKALENGFVTSKKKNQKELLVVTAQTDKKQKKDKGNKTPAKTDKTLFRDDKTPGMGDKVPGKNDKSASKRDKMSGKVEKTPGKSDKTPTKSPKQDGTPKKRTVEGGVMIEDLRVGNGQVAKPGKIIKVYYEGRLKSNNKMFDSSTKGNGFEFRLGRQEVIKGWDIGVAGMKVGGKRRVICPPNTAYGQKGSPPTIPPNSTLVFDVELKNVKN